jgi:hypothetical protein
VRRLAIVLLLVGCHGDRVVAGHPDVATWTETNQNVTASAPPPSTPGPMGPFYEADPEGHPTVILRADAPNVHYANLTSSACEAELGRRAIPYVRTTATPDVATPVRLRGALHGVLVHSMLPPAQRDTSPSEIFDCRLVLAVDDFCGLLAKRDVVEVVHFTAYRPRAQSGCTPKYAGLQHCGALALDVASFTKKDGTVLVVDKDFHGRVGDATCAGKAHPSPPSAAATELWGYVCDAASQAIFNVMLTPNYNAEHHNHIHVEVTPDAEWMLIK